MARNKVHYTYINNPMKGKATFKKRKNGYLKEVDEITTLCDIQACVIIYTLDEPEPEVWPSNKGMKKGDWPFHVSILCWGNNLDNENIIDYNDITLLADKKLEITKKNENFQVQEVTLAIENGGETMTEGEQALVANVAAISNMNWSNDNNNEDDGDVIHVNIGRC
ncbi:hypothetical protein GYH30_000853 [Glycine max]|uniref:MADS-box domain-containing protein n=2 Tax=Glycine subgen. Soja TaxID=1462606 RepID=A0A0R0L878_SOYBN|nr:hypothetical protein GYH30_000853 [Glycine max]